MRLLWILVLLFAIALPVAYSNALVELSDQSFDVAVGEGDWVVMLYGAAM